MDHSVADLSGHTAHMSDCCAPRGTCFVRYFKRPLLLDRMVNHCQLRNHSFEKGITRWYTPGSALLEGSFSGWNSEHAQPETEHRVGYRPR